MADEAGKEIRELYTDAVEADRENYDEALIDLRFEGFDQWDERVRNWRESGGNGSSPFPLPCLTINTTQQYTALIVGDWLANETAITVLPREDGTTEIAQVRSELIRGIELQSKAERIYARALGQAAGCGISNFRVDIDYAYEDAFERDIFIRGIPNPLGVKWDPLSYDPTGRDAGYCFVEDEMTDDEYSSRFPKAARPTLIEKDAGSTWSNGKTVKVPEFFRIIEKTRLIAMTFDGKTVDLTDEPEGKWPKLLKDPQTGEPVKRKCKVKYSRSVLTNGIEELGDATELRLHRLPIIRVMGREVITGEKRVRFGVTRCIRDSQRMKNYMRSLRAELLMRAPRANFMGSKKAFKGLEGDWGDVLTWNDEAQAPPVPITGQNIAALLNEENMFAQDMRDVTGIHEASAGAPSNETSGVAIQARQSEGDVATIIYHHHMTQAQQEGGEVVDALIPQVFDTARTIRCVGPDLGVKMVRVNEPKPDEYEKRRTDPTHPKHDPTLPPNVDIGEGRYDTTISTGPAFMTRRQQASTAMMQLIHAKPDLAGLIGDLVVKEMDIPNGDKIAERIKRTIPPQVLGDDSEDGKTPEEIQAAKAQAMQAQQMQQAAARLEMGTKQAAMREANAKADLAEAQAMKAKVDAMREMMGGQQPAEPVDPIEQARVAVEGYNAITNRIKAVSASAGPASPPDLAAHIGPIVTAAIAQALAAHDQFAPVGVGSIPPPAPGVSPAEGVPQ